MRVSWCVAVAVLAFACGGRTGRLPGEDDSAGAQGGGSSATAGQSSMPTGGTTLLPMTPSGGTPSVPIPTGGAGGASGAGGAGSAGAAGEPAVACNLPWWGSTLEGVVGAHECPPPDSPALFAYARAQIPLCSVLTGPLEQQVVGEQVRCRYDYDQRGCGNDLHGDWWIALPVFGYGADDVTVPKSVPPMACAMPSGALIETRSALEQAKQLLGVWLTCQEGDPDPFPGNALAFFPDGSYRALQVDAQGGVSRATGCDNTGLWGFLPDTGELDIFFNDQTFSTFVSFTQNPGRTLKLGAQSPGSPNHSGRTFMSVGN